jgi:hypothetical protein
LSERNPASGRLPPSLSVRLLPTPLATDGRGWAWTWLIALLNPLAAPGWPTSATALFFFNLQKDQCKVRWPSEETRHIWNPCTCNRLQCTYSQQFHCYQAQETLVKSQFSKGSFKLHHCAMQKEASRSSLTCCPIHLLASSNSQASSNKNKCHYPNE